jgi:hypothetical protein
MSCEKLRSRGPDLDPAACLLGSRLGLLPSTLNAAEFRGLPSISISLQSGQLTVVFRESGVGGVQLNNNTTFSFISRELAQI